ncbi:MAG TPA: TIGR04283 family arsenosugar biosynthesis glycosyltransferase [Rhizomicrobium sp.]|nr:TIGR04283 family arsenosugar biosynthesis glycosyltransferase [Rhizomicrobium sp.]
MISVIIPTLNAEKTLARCLERLIAGVVVGTVREVIIADGGSTDETAAIAEATGANFIEAPQGRGSQLAAGAEIARGEWLLFLHADTVLEQGWEAEAASFIERAMPGRERAASFRFALDDFEPAARRLERLVALRCWLFALPYGDQGLLISKRHYRKIGGFRPMALMEDVDIMRRIGRSRLVMLRARAITSAERFRREGYLRRSVRNLSILLLYALRVPPRLLARLYG